MQTMTILNLVEDVRVEKTLVNEQSLHGIAGGWVVRLRVHHDLDRLDKKTLVFRSTIQFNIIV